MLNNLLSVSIVIPTKNSAKLLESCLNGILKQSYKNKEIIISDGMSTDNTVDIARKYKVRIIKNPQIMAEPGIYFGMKVAKGDLIMVIAVDNIFKNKEALKIMVNVFRDKKIYAAFPKHDSLERDSLFTKYINTFTDPFNHFVYGYAANNRTFSKIYKTIEHNFVYDVYDFSSKKILPILALAQGLIVRKDFIKNRENIYDDIVPIVDLIKKKKMIAYVYSVSLIHHTVKNINHFWRKQRWAAKNFFNKKNYGFSSRMNTLTNWQKIKAYIYPFYSISIVFPFLFSFYASLRDREKMWLFHSFIAFISGLAMWWEFVRIKVNLDKEVSRL